MNTSKTLIYDGSFNGFLTAVFTGFEQKISKANIQRKDHAPNDLFTETIFTNLEKAKRVWNGVRDRSNYAIKSIYFAFLSEQKGIEPILYNYIQKLMRSKENKVSDFSEDAIFKINRLTNRVEKEKHHIETCLRFQLTKDEIHFANIEPDFDILPLVSKHFRSCYPDEQWIIYDVKRKYGLFYNLQYVELISLDLQDAQLNSLNGNIVLTNDEYDNQELWSNYFQNTNIKSRINKKLHAQHLPKRDCKYLSEKKVS